MHARIRDSRRSVRSTTGSNKGDGTEAPPCKYSEIHRGPSTSFQRCKTRQPTAENITITHGHLKHQLQDPTACILQPTKVFQHKSITYNPYSVYSQPGWPPNSRKCKNANDHKPKTALKSLLPDEDPPCHCKKSSVSPHPSQINFRPPPGRHRPRGIAMLLNLTASPRPKKKQTKLDRPNEKK